MTRTIDTINTKHTSMPPFRCLHHNKVVAKATDFHPEDTSLICDVTHTSESLVASGRASEIVPVLPKIYTLVQMNLQMCMKLKSLLHHHYYYRDYHYHRPASPLFSNIPTEIQSSSLSSHDNDKSERVYVYAMQCCKST